MSSHAAGAGRLTAVDALRGLAALGVVCCHVPRTYPTPGHYRGWLFLPAEFGKHGVALFLVISGFCIHLGAARALARGEGARCDWRAFWARRFRRLYPPYLAAALLTLLVALVLFPNYSLLRASYQSGEISPGWDVLTHLLMVHNLFTDYQAGLGNGPFWTLGLEEQLYALYAVLLLLRSRLPAWGVLAVAAGVTLLWYAVGVGSDFFLGRPWLCWPNWPFAYWLLWALGAVAAEAHTGALALPRWCSSRPVGLALLAGGALLVPPVPHMLYADGGLARWLGPGHPLERVSQMFIPLHLPSVYLVGGGCFVLLNGWLRAEREGRPAGRPELWLARLGVMSYSLYLTHAPALLACEAAFSAAGITPTIAGTLLRYAVCVPACLAVAWAFFRLVERHFLNTRPAGGGARTKGDGAHEQRDRGSADVGGRPAGAGRPRRGGGPHSPPDGRPGTRHRLAVPAGGIR
jgi:peptidoglycan/LPS O-acetylase OafA/YrhL